MQHQHIEKLAQQFEDAEPAEILAWAAQTYGERLAIVTSFQITGIATLHMLQRIAPRTPVLTLDTGLLFPETLDLINDLVQRFQLDLRRVKPRQTPKQQARDYGDRLWERNPDRCCHIRKTIPLRDALVGFQAWVTGVRRDQSAGRANTPILSHDSRSGLVKIAPFANWSEEQVWAYIREHDLPFNRLHRAGYPSIGCWPCTNAGIANSDARSGRWTNHAKTECGIHLPYVEVQAREAAHA